MSWQDAKTEAESIAATLDPSFKGKLLQVPDFDTDADCSAFYPYCLGFHRMILSALRKIAWKRGTHEISTTKLRATPRFLAMSRGERAAFADSLFELRQLPSGDATAKKV